MFINFTCSALVAKPFVASASNCIASTVKLYKLKTPGAFLNASLLQLSHLKFLSVALLIVTLILLTAFIGVCRHIAQETNVLFAPWALKVDWVLVMNLWVSGPDAHQVFFRERLLGRLIHEVTVWSGTKTQSFFLHDRPLEQKDYELFDQLRLCILKKIPDFPFRHVVYTVKEWTFNREVSCVDIILD